MLTLLSLMPVPLGGEKAAISPIFQGDKQRHGVEGMGQVLSQDLQP